MRTTQALLVRYVIDRNCIYIPYILAHSIPHRPMWLTCSIVSRTRAHRWSILELHVCQKREWALLWVFPHLTMKECLYLCHVYSNSIPSKQISGQIISHVTVSMVYFMVHTVLAISIALYPAWVKYFTKSGMHSIWGCASQLSGN